MSCSPHHPKKLSRSATQPTIIMSQFAHGAANCGANGPSHQMARTNLKIRSSLPKFCFISILSFCSVFHIFDRKTRIERQLRIR